MIFNVLFLRHHIYLFSAAENGHTPSGRTRTFWNLISASASWVFHADMYNSPSPCDIRARLKMVGTPLERSENGFGLLLPLFPAQVFSLAPVSSTYTHHEQGSVDVFSSSLGPHSLFLSTTAP